MSVSTFHIADFMSIFKGNGKNYGQHIYKYTEGDKKENGKNATIKDKLVTELEYKEHLNGEKGLGIIPINEANKCTFAVIDVDIYSKSLDMYVEAIEQNNFPLVPFKSKSGGLHIYMFLRTAADAKVVTDIMRRMAAILSIDLLVKQDSNRMVEIFPKQYKLDAKQVGTWINIPYYNATEKSRTPALKNGQALSLPDAISYIKDKKCTIEEAKGFLENLPFKDGPPCLQSIYTLSALGNGGGRSNYLFSFGVYLKKKDENFFEQALFDVNRSLSHPLPGDELERTVLSSIRKKDYSYKCNDSPCVDYCKKTVCKTRDYGIGKDGGYFSNLEYGTLTQFKTYEPYYEWEIKQQGSDNSRILRFKNEEEIIKQDAFLRLCLRELHILPVKLAQGEWFKVINQALSEIKIADVGIEDDTSNMSMFRMIFFEFLLERAPAATRDQILSKRAYFETTKQEYCFRTNDLMDYLFLIKNFRNFTAAQVHGVLRDFGCRNVRLRTESGKQLRVTAMPKAEIDKHTTIVDVPYVIEYDENTEEDF